MTLRDIKLAGESAADKLKRVRAELEKLRADALVVSDPQNVAWTFNIRGSDVAHTPLALAFALIPREGRPRLYVEPASSTTRRARRSKTSPTCARRDDLDARPRRASRTRRVRLDQASAAEALSQDRQRATAASRCAAPIRSR